MRGNKLHLGAAAAALIAAASLAVASEIRLGTDGFVDNYDVNPGETISVDVYLYEVFDPQAETSILDNEDGIFSAGVLIERMSFGQSEPAAVLSAADIAHNPSFDENDPLISPIKFVLLIDGTFDSASLVESRDLFATTGVAPEAPAPDTRRVYLGTFTLTAGTVWDEITAFQITDNDPVLEDTVTGALPGTALDPEIQPFEFTVTVLPEPASLFVLGILASAGLIRRKRRM